MKQFKVISNPICYPQSRYIRPTDFIEQWSLCPDLSQAIIYLERAVHVHRDNVEASLNALKIAQGHLFNKYLAECIQLSLGRTFDSILYDAHLFQKMRTSPFPMMAEAISKEWGLSIHLKEVVFYITVYKNFYPHFPYMRPICLKQSLKHLQREISAKEQLIVTSIDETKGGEKMVGLIKDRKFRKFKSIHTMNIPTNIPFSKRGGN